MVDICIFVSDIHVQNVRWNWQAREILTVSAHPESRGRTNSSAIQHLKLICSIWRQIVFRCATLPNRIANMHSYFFLRYCKSILFWFFSHRRRNPPLERIFMFHLDLLKTILTKKRLLAALFPIGTRFKGRISGTVWVSPITEGGIMVLGFFGNWDVMWMGWDKISCLAEKANARPSCAARN